MNFKEHMVKLVAEALASYEMDEPHVDSPNSNFSQDSIYPEVSFSTLQVGATQEHHGDCVNLPCSCYRCFSDHILHKAEWITNNVLSKVSGEHPLSNSINDLREHLSHGSWRCERYKECHCGLDDLCEELNIPKIPL